jgi:intracellular septation protein A
MTERSSSDTTAADSEAATDPARDPAREPDPAGAGGQPPSEQALSEEAPAKRVPLLVEQLGGWRGLFDSTLPVIVFVVANTAAGLTVAIWSAIGAALLVAGLRLARRQTVQQAVSGLFGVVVAAFIAHRTGNAKGFFLFGIWASFGYAGLFFASALVRWPLVGVIWEYVESTGAAWRRDRRLMRVYVLLTLMWSGVFLARGLVQHYLYDSDKTGWLAFARISMGYPVTLAALGLTLLLVRRVRRRAALTEAVAVPD